MKKFNFLSGLLVFAILTLQSGPTGIFAAQSESEPAPGRKMALQATRSEKLWNTADHSKHELLKQELSSGPEVTKA